MTYILSKNMINNKSDYMVNINYQLYIYTKQLRVNYPFAPNTTINLISVIVNNIVCNTIKDLFSGG